MSNNHPQSGIGQHFQDSAALLGQCGELLAEPAATVAETLLAALMNDGKLLVCGNGMAAALADALCSHLVTGLEQERMELAALSLSNNSAILSAMAEHTPADQQFAKQIRALGKQHDVLWVISLSGNEANLLAAVDAAHERDMHVVALSGGMSSHIGGALANRLREQDCLLYIPHMRAMRIWEAQAVLIHAVCDHLDALLLGNA